MNLCRATTCQNESDFLRMKIGIAGLLGSVKFDMSLVWVAGQASGQRFGFHSHKFNREQAFDKSGLHHYRIPVLESESHTDVPHQMLEVRCLQPVFRVRHTFEGDVFGSICRIVTPRFNLATELHQVFFCSERCHLPFDIIKDGIDK